MTGDDLFEILAEVLIESHRGIALPGFAKDLGNGPSAAMLCTQHSHRPVVLLDDDLDALLHPGQHAVKIAGHLGFFFRSKAESSPSAT